MYQSNADKNHAPSLTIVIPVFNEEAYIEQTIVSGLRQSHKDIQFIIGDNASTDSSWEIIKNAAKLDNRITAFRHPVNFGASQNIEILVRHSRSPYTALLGGHDILDPDWASILLNCHRIGEGKYSLVYSRTLWIDSAGSSLRETDGGSFVRLEDCPIKRLHSCISHEWGECTAVNGIFKTTVLKAFSHPACNGPDHILLARASYMGNIMRVESPLYHRRDFVKQTTYYQRIKGNRRSNENSSLSCQVGAYIAECLFMTRELSTTFSILLRLPSALKTGYDFSFLRFRTGPLKALLWSFYFSFLKVRKKIKQQFERCN
jgi:glycosyltransferase involved in cell wall biosynthesis